MTIINPNYHKLFTFLKRMTIINTNYYNLYTFLKQMTIINPNFYNIIIHISGQNYSYYSNSFPLSLHFDSFLSTMAMEWMAGRSWMPRRAMRER